MPAGSAPSASAAQNRTRSRILPKRSNKDPDDATKVTKDWFAKAERIADGPDALRAYLKRSSEEIRRRGPQKAPTKRLVSLRLSPDVLETYKGTGRGWQTRIDEDLKKAAKRIRAAS